ncbi:DNA-binding response regulator [Acrocarpospora phusangensis]|uniref:DNA-binding response regulator n=1 Tax=Acrocarpospora phusangensis TaxID=1070424 RepID=A0A919ULJ0_9ACTN|nr:sigma factor-like helix-turn-helix DNA-binding protein [Acrocarpospora phusangensis]GIH22247.1 DNA-binding response regulator [Acrocarpospora phusangensis]
MGAGQVDRTVTAAIVEDLDVVVEGVRSWVAADPGRRVSITAVVDSVDALLAGPGREADVVVLDLDLGRDMVTDRVPELSDLGLRVVVFSVHVKPLVVQAVMDAGACAFLDKRTGKHHFVDTLAAVAGDEPYVTPSMAGGLLQAARLSEREREALVYLFQGMSHESIARRMKKPGGAAISPATVKQYIGRARAKFAAMGRPCASNFALLARCIEDGLIRPDQVEDYRSAGR